MSISLRPIRTAFFFLLLLPGPTFAQTTNPDSGPLKIHVTAVQGGAQFRPDADTKWQPVTANLDASEGVEFRTGPKGTIQFTVGSDQVYRVDRLTVVKVLRANLNADGTIRTDVGMTYGRVSKDVDLPQHPHQDTIISPSSTLAVRGTEVSMYDQPPFAPQAVSLTGNALYHPKGGTQFSFGSKGGGTNTVSNDAVGAAQFQLNGTLIDPNGSFSGHTATELQNIQNTPGTLIGTPLSTLQTSNATIAGMTNTSTAGGTVPTGDIPGAIAAEFSWTGNVSSTTVGFTILDPHGVIYSSLSPPISGTNAPIFIGSPTANQSISDEADIAGFEEFFYGGSSNGTFPAGNYKITITLEGAAGESLSQFPSASVTGELIAIELPPGSVSPVVRRGATQNGAIRPADNPMPVNANSSPFTLNSTNSTATFNIIPPLHPGNTLVPVLSH